jgi:hypothetical protein
MEERWHARLPTDMAEIQKLSFSPLKVSSLFSNGLHLGYLGLPRLPRLPYAWANLGLPWDTLSYHGGLPWATLGYHTLPWATLGVLRLHWASLGVLRLYWASLDVHGHGRAWACLGVFGVLGLAWACLGLLGLA